MDSSQELQHRSETSVIPITCIKSDRMLSTGFRPLRNRHPLIIIRHPLIIISPLILNLDANVRKLVVCSLKIKREIPTYPISGNGFNRRPLSTIIQCSRSHALAQLVEALRRKAEGRRFDFPIMSDFFH